MRRTTAEPRGGVPEDGVLDALDLRVASIQQIALLNDGSMSFTGRTSFDLSPFFRWRATSDGGVVDFRDMVDNITRSPWIVPVQMSGAPEGGVLMDGLFSSALDGNRLVQRLDGAGVLHPLLGGLGRPVGQIDYQPSEEVRLEYILSGERYAGYRGLAADPRGAVYVAQARVRDGGVVENAVARILRSQAGYSQTIAGPPSDDETVDQVLRDLCRVAADDPQAAIPARSVTFRFLRDLAARADGVLMAAVNCDIGPWAGDFVLFEISSPFEGSLEVPHIIAAEDRSALYEFDEVGRHLRTRDPISGHTLWSFTYDSLGRVSTLRDRENQLTRITYAEGSVTVTAPGGLATTLTLDEDGYATTIAGPDLPGGILERQVWTATYDEDTETQLGLLRSITLPGDAEAHSFSYEADGSGRLRSDADLSDTASAPPTQVLSEETGAVFSELRGVPLDAVRQVTLRSAMGRERSFAMHREGGQLWTRAEMPSGAFTERLDLGRSLGRAEQLHYDGSRSSTQTSRDPVYDLDAAYVSRGAFCRPSVLSAQPSSCFDVSPEARLEVTRERTTPTSTEFNDSVTVAGDTWGAQYMIAARTINLRGPNGRVVTATYDAQGRVRRIQRPDQYPICISYTGHRISAIRQGNYDATCGGSPSLRRVATFEWDTSGRRWLEGVISGYGTSAMTTDFVPDPNRGLATEVRLPGRSSHTVLRFDAQSRLTSVVPAGHAPVDDYVYRYTPRGFFFSESSPRSEQVDGTVYPEEPAETSEARYSEDGEMLTLDRRGACRLAWLALRTGTSRA
ncbi:MAG: hypothetical protein U0353_23375 [Sandaracinus sp.]